ncbi:uncharacterized protein LOC122856912 isoform X2 [Aphidius gifuensis]|uniref:uncharacterized protein LOC122856912 isoform X2 n=1 Tax=Aphidius gifuensis TaxID=684658 RepID=UPI001CDC2DF2|nr:uncharacterized protein LOC122856912 isoform X2 [Aphidius gifuensis]
MLGKLEVDKIVKRKCKNKSQISTQSNKKRRKVYPQHNDHSYVKNIIIDLVNDDCLSEIFMYVPICERPKIAQVCKKWNRVVCSYCFKVKTLVLSHWEYDRPKNILEKFKKSFCRIPVILLVSLKNVVNTLNELTVINQSKDIFTLCRFPNILVALIRQFKALQKIETGGMLITKRMYGAIVDAKLNFYYHEHVYGKLNNVMNRELTSITVITLSEKYEITDDNLYNLANSFKFLTRLTANCSLVTDVGIQAITKMKHLEDLFLTGENYVTDTPLKLLKGMKRLELPDSYKITNNSIKKILENSPYMYELSFKNTSITPEFLTIVEKVSEKRKINMRLYVQFPGRCVSVIERQYLYVHCVCGAIH